VRKQKAEAEALKKRQEAERKATEAALAKRRKEQEALEVSVKDAMEAVKTVVESVQHHETNRKELEAETLEAFRKEFQTNKKSLKTDLKKCTAFVKKIKSGSAWTMKPEEVIRDVSTLNLSRYVDEVVTALLDAKLKVGDLPQVVALCKAMHLRYEEFLANLLSGLWAVIQGKATEETAKNRRLYVRLVTEFVLNGLVVDTKPLVKLIGDATGGKDGSYAVTDANLVVAFGKAAGYEIFGIRPRSLQIYITLLKAESQKAKDADENAGDAAAAGGEDVGGDTITKEGPVVIPANLAESALALVAKIDETLTNLAVPFAISEVFHDYCAGAYQTLSNSLVATHAKLQKLEKRCEQDRLLSGTLPEAREKGLSDARKLLESLQKSVDTLSDVLDQPMPQLAEDENDEENAGGGGLELWTKGGGDGGEDSFGPFDDEETRVFYCDIPDLLTTVPPGLLGISPEEIERRKEENLRKYGSGFDAESVGDEGGTDDEVPAFSSEALSEEEDEEQDEDAESEQISDEVAEQDKDTPHYKLTVLLEQELPECNRREQIDEIAEKFCTNNGSSKNSRKRLSKTLFLVPRSRLDLLPYYARMTAILDRIWQDDIAPPLVKELEQQFHGQTKFKKNQNIDSRFKTARYIGELTKFRVAPPIVALRCLKRCCDDFSGANIDVACCLLESCGRFLYRIKHTNARIVQLLDTITRLSKAVDLDERAQSLIKAAFYTVKPPAGGPKKRVKEYSPVELYLRHLLMVQLEPDTNSVSFVSKQLIRFPWNDPSEHCGALMCKIMMKTCRKGRYKVINALAAVAANLRRHRPEVSIRLIDAVLEELQWAIEHPNFGDQQRIIAYARLLGELFCVSLVSGQLIIQQLYNFINIGHEIPESLREASKKQQETVQSGTAAGAATGEENDNTVKLPVYNSTGGAVTAITEDEEMEDSPLVTKKDEEAVEQKPVAVSQYSQYDPRVPSVVDAQNSAFRVKLVCVLLEVVAKSLVVRSNITRLQNFLIAFQRYLFTKISLPAEVEFSLLDTFDAIDSAWKKAIQDGGRVSRQKKESHIEDEDDLGFPRCSNWLEAHNATVVSEEADHLAEARSRARIEALAGESTSEALYGMDGDSLQYGDGDDSMADENDEDAYDSDDPLSLSASAKDSVTDEQHFGIESGDEEEEEVGEEYDETSDDDSESDDSDSDEDDDDEEEFDEEAYLAQLEAEAFERELRRVTKEALEKGKVAARSTAAGKVAESMPMGSQTIKKKQRDNANAPSEGSVFALGGGAGISFHLLKKGHKGKMEAKEIIVPTDTNLAKAAGKQDDAAARERDMIKARVLQYEAESAEAQFSGGSGNVYIEQDKLQVIRNRPLSMDVIDRNFGTSGGNLRQGDRPSTGGRSVGGGTGPPQGGGRGGSGGRGGRGRGRSASGRGLV